MSRQRATLNKDHLFRCFSANLTGEDAFVEHVQQLLVHAVDLKSKGSGTLGRRR